MIDYRVAIPSHNRATLLEKGTLAVLVAGGVHLDRVTVFLDEGDPQEQEYRAAAARLGFHVATHAVKGINAQRRMISYFYPAGTPVVSMDDDVQGVLRATDPKTLVPVEDLHALFQHAFEITSGEGLSVWGVSAVVNPFFMRDSASTNLKFLIATLWGYFSRPGHPVHDTVVQVKEDYEFSLRAWWYDGGAVRFNNIAVKADHYKAPGGCQDYRDAEVSRMAAETLVAMWPGLVRINQKRKSGHAEVLLSRKQRHDGHPVTVPPPGDGGSSGDPL